MFTSRPVHDQNRYYRSALSGLWQLVCLLLCIHLQGQTPHFFRHFTEKDGLSSNNVTCILRESRSYLWVGTNYGLNRYDGRAFKQFLPGTQGSEAGISNEYITALAQDEAGFIWIATRKGLNRYDPRTRQFRSWFNTGANDGSLPNDLIAALLPDGQRLWIACDNRDLAYLDLKTGVFHQYPWKKFTDASLPASVGKDYKTIYSIKRKSERQLWLNTSLGLMIFDTWSGQFELCPPTDKAPPALQTEDFDCAEHLLMGTWDQDVLCYNPCRQRWSQLRLPLATGMRDGFRRVTTIARDAERHWILSEQGLYVYEQKSKKISHIPPKKDNANHVPTGPLSTYLADFQGLRWFGGEQGLWQMDPFLQFFSFLPLDTTPYASYANRYARLLDVPALNRRFISDLYQGQLLVLENGRLIKKIPVGGICYILKEDHEGRIWVSGGLNLYQLDPKSLKLSKFSIKTDLFEANKTSFLSDFDIDHSGNYWFAGSNCGLLIYRPDSQNWEKPGAAQGFISRNINCLYADWNRQQVWVGSEDYGLFQYNPKTQRFKLYQPDSKAPDRSLGAYMIRDVGYTRYGYMWVASDPGGLSRFDYNAQHDIFSNYNISDGLPSNQVCSIVQDTSGRLWAGSTKGLIYVGEKNIATPVFWDKNSGLLNEYLDLPLSVGADGNIYMGGAQGMAYVNPDSLLRVRREPPVLLNSFKVFDRELLGTFRDTIVLPWRDNFFSIAFASANLSTPERSCYSTHLEGFEPYPVAQGNQTYRAFTKVPPGKYKLIIMAYRPNTGTGYYSVWIIIEPPFWQTWWFRLLAIGALIAGIWGLYRYRVEQIRREERLKSAFNQRLAQVEMSALRAQMNPHFVFNCLNSINRFILVNEPETASEYLTKFSRLIRLILDNSRSETVPLDKELDALRLYIEMEAMRFEGRFEYQIMVDPSLQPEHLEVPPLIIQPYVENAIWHGLMHQKERGKLRIKVAPLGRAVLPGNGGGPGLFIQIEDNGVGRARAQELKSKSAQSTKSHGMELTDERIRMIRSLYGVEAQIQVEDLYSPEGAAAGTRVNITIA